MTHSLIALFQRDLTKLSQELEAYPSEESLWLVAHDITNPAGNLTLHLVGNLNQFIGVVLGDTGYQRNRDAEFGSRDIPKAELISMVQATSTMIESVLKDVNVFALEQPYPQEVLGYPMTTSYFLIHLYGHLNWHLGQINYHRRLTASN